VSFNAAMFDPASLVTKRDDGASGLAPGEPGAQQQQNTGYSRTASGGYQPDPAVTDRRGGARRLDLAGPAGMPDGLAHEVDPSPVWVRQSGLNDLVHGRVQATPADIPSGTPGSAANWGGPSTHPLATAIASHGSAAFGFQPSNVSLGFRE